MTDTPTWITPPLPTPLEPVKVTTLTQTSAWDHFAAVAAPILAVIVAIGDFHTGQMFSQGGDVALALAGFGALGVKGTFPGSLPRS